jgi:hypothetical protein
MSKSADPIEGHVPDAQYLLAVARTWVTSICGPLPRVTTTASIDKYLSFYNPTFRTPHLGGELEGTSSKLSPKRRSSYDHQGDEGHHGA